MDRSRQPQHAIRRIPTSRHLLPHHQHDDDDNTTTARQALLLSPDKQHQRLHKPQQPSAAASPASPPPRLQQARRPLRNSSSAVSNGTGGQPLRLPSKAHAYVEGDVDTIFVVRRRHVVQLPRGFRLTPGADVLLRLCREFSNSAACPRAHACPCVHALLFVTPDEAAFTANDAASDVTPRFTRHVAPADGAWGAFADIPYPWVILGRGGQHQPQLRQQQQQFDEPQPCATKATTTTTATVAPPATATATTGVAVVVVALRTRATEECGADGCTAPLEPCSHWLRAGVCHFGRMCKYMHVARLRSVRSAATIPNGNGDDDDADRGGGERNRRRYPFVHNPYRPRVAHHDDGRRH